MAVATLIAVLITAQAAIVSAVWAVVLQAMRKKVPITARGIIPRIASGITRPTLSSGAVHVLGRAVARTAARPGGANCTTST